MSYAFNRPVSQRDLEIDIPCATASLTPIRARFSSSNERNVKGNAPAFFWISEKTVLEVFIFN